MPDRPSNPVHLLHEGTIDLPFGAPRGIISAGNPVSASNNEMWGVRFDSGSDGSWRFNVPNLPGYSGGDVTIRAYWTSADAGAVNEKAVWDMGYYFPRVGVALGVFVDVRMTVDMATYVVDTVYSTDFVIPAASIVPTADLLCLRVYRRWAVAPVEFPHGIYMHFFKALYTGLL